jgi:hypothetical protein
MPRQSVYIIIAAVLVIGAIVLFLQRDNTGTSSPSPSVAGSGAHPPPTGATDPAPGGTISPIDRSTAPPSATGRAPSGEPARPVERR